MKQSLQEMIEAKRRQLASAPPHSRRRHLIWYQLHELMQLAVRRAIKQDEAA